MGSNKLVAYILCFLFFVVAECYDFQTLYYEQQVDHFSFSNADTYQQRYLLNDVNWDRKGSGPIFFYTGNEGNIEWFANNTGFMWDIAPQFKAMVVFAEHRYYGTSMPYGKDSYKDLEHLGYLSAEQALADFAKLITYLKANIPGAENSPVVVFGGSYGGMLAAWFRMKYPHLAVGAIASSAPVLQFPGLTDCGVYNKIVTDAFTREGEQCPKSVRQSFNFINELGVSADGRRDLATIFRLCKPLKDEQDVLLLKSWLVESLGNVAMVNYPYPANFMAPLPAWPIKEMCSHLTNSSLESSKLLEGFFEALNIYYNYTGSTPCLDITSEGTALLEVSGWDFQTCAEMVMPMCADGVNDMFDPYPWSYELFAQDCKKTYNISTRPESIKMMFAGRNLSSFSNIIFINGLLDPWSGGGVLQSISDSVISVIIPEGAHHLDLRSADPADPLSVIAARKTEKKYIRQWITQEKARQAGKKSWKVYRALHRSPKESPAMTANMDI